MFSNIASVNSVNKINTETKDISGPPQARKNWGLQAYLTIGDGSEMGIKKAFFQNRICKVGK